MKRVAVTILALVIALIPTYFIIFNSLHSSGLPDFSTQETVEVVCPATEDDENHRSLSFDKHDGEFQLLVVFLSGILPVNSLPASVNRNAFYKITFVSARNIRNTTLLYMDDNDFSPYIVTAQGKVYQVTVPQLSDGRYFLWPAFLGYLKDGQATETYATKTLEKRSDTAGLSFSVIPDRLHVVYYDGSGEDKQALLTTDRLEASVPGAEFVTITADWAMKDGWVYRATYAILLETPS